MSHFQAFAVVRVPFPFTDRQAQKRRPALVLSQPYFQQTSGHLLLAMITSARQSSWPLDWPIEDYAAAGLPHACVVRFKLFTLDARLVLNQLGELGDGDQDGVATQLAKLLPITPRTPSATLSGRQRGDPLRPGELPGGFRTGAGCQSAARAFTACSPNNS
jgi:mRNA interferase MazF